MSYNPFVRWWSRSIAFVMLMASPFAYATPTTGDTSGTAAIKLLELSGGQLSTGTLAHIRGGFDIPSQGLTINFAFSQIDSVNGTVVQSILVPMSTLTKGATASPIIVSTDGNTAVIPAGVPNINVKSFSNDGQTVVLSQFGGGGISNLISNQANNAEISQMTTMDISISGMSQWLSQQQTNAGLSSSLGYGEGALR